MARSTKGLYKRGNVWWITYFDALGHQRFESSKFTNKRDAEKRLVDRRKEAHEGLLPAPPIKPLSLEELRRRYLAFVGHQRGVEIKHIHFAHFTRVWGSPRFIRSRWRCWTSTVHDGLGNRSDRPRSTAKWRH